MSMGQTMNDRPARIMCHSAPFFARPRDTRAPPASPPDRCAATRSATRLGLICLAQRTKAFELDRAGFRAILFRLAALRATDKAGSTDDWPFAGIREERRPIHRNAPLVG
jgi:hypothetical protein